MLHCKRNGEDVTGGGGGSRHTHIDGRGEGKDALDFS